MKRSALALVLSLTAVFISGAAVGALGYRFFTAGTTEQVVQLPPAPDVYRRNYVDFLKHRLELTDEQVASLQQIMDNTRQRMDELNQKTEPEIQQIMQQQFDETLEVLNEEQQAEFQKFLEERSSFRGRRQNWDDRRGERPPPPQGTDRGTAPTDGRRGRAPNPSATPAPKDPAQ